MKARNWVVLAALVAGLSVLAGCGSSDDSSSGSSSSASGDGGEIVYASPVASQPGQQEVFKGMEDAAKEVGWSAAVLDSNLSPEKQVSNIETAINKKVKAIGSATLDPGAAAGAYNRALDAGIPVIGVNSEGDGLTSSVFWETIACEKGGPQEENAEYIAEKSPGANVIIIDGPPAPAIIQEVECFEKAAEAAGLNIVNKTANTGDTADAAQKLAQDLLTKYSDVEAVWAYNDQSALGMSAALASQGDKVATDSDPGVIVIGNTGDPEGIEGVEDNRLTATWDPNNVATGWAVVKLMQTALDEGVDKTYPPLVVEATFYTSANVAEFVPADERSYSIDSVPVVGG
jgi:ribose transport system substrate-binding protein